MTKKEQIKIFIKNNISKGTWKYGYKILSENQLSDMFKISRGTAKDAINELYVEGFLERKQGQGTFVKKTEIKQEYILILTDLRAFTGEIRHSNRNVLRKLKEHIVELGYKSVVFMNNGVMDLQNTLDELSGQLLGIIDFYSIASDREKISKINVPCVSIQRAVTIGYPCVLLDVNGFFNIILDIIKKNKYKNILVFNIKSDFQKKKKSIREEYYYYPIEIYFEKYKLFKISPSKDKTININRIKEAFDSVKKTPDAVIFLDDTLFIFAIPLFDKYDFLKQVPIYTQSSKNLDIPKGYNVTQIAYDHDVCCLKAIELLEKMIKGEFIREYSIYIKPTLIPGEK